MSDSVSNKAPIWFWALAIIFLLWNIMGVLSFFFHTMISEDFIEHLPENEQALYGEYSIWTNVLFAVATFGGFIGSVGLLFKKKWAKTFFILSFLGIVPQMIHNVFFTSAIDVYGFSQAVTMPLLVVFIGMFLIWYSGYSIKKNWLK